MNPEDKRQELLGLAERVVRKARVMGATVAEVSAREGNHLSVKVRSGQVEHIEEAGSRSLGLRVLIGQKRAVTYTSDFSEQGSQQLIEDAIALASLSQDDPFLGVPESEELMEDPDSVSVESFDPKMGDIQAAEAVERASQAEQGAFDADSRIDNSEGASFARTAGCSALVTSGGFRGFSYGSYGSLSVSPIVKDESGQMQRGGYWDARRFVEDLRDPVEVGKEAARRTVRKIGAKKIPSSKMPVIFDKDTARSILGHFASCVMGGSIWRKSSYLVQRLDTTVASPLVTIVDNPLVLRGPGSRVFDGEGLASRENSVVESGVLQTYLMGGYDARKLGSKSTANASRGSSGGVGSSTTNFVMSAGDATPESIIEDTKKGLFVTEMMGFGFNAVTGDFSRGASGFLIENGKLTQPVSEVTISLNLDTLLQSIDAVGNDIEMMTSTVSPTFRVSEMTISGS